MMVQIGNFLFRYRNMLFPVLCLPLFYPAKWVIPQVAVAIAAGLMISTAGQVIRILTIGLAYIIRGGRDHKVYAKDLVTEGVFSHCRNPLYVGNIMVITGLGLMSNSVYGIFVLPPLAVFAYQAIVRAEEAFLKGKFGDEYTAYTKRVNRWLPDLRGLGNTLVGMEFKWGRVLVKEYNSTYVWTTLAVLLIAEDLYVEGERTGFYPFQPLFMALLVVLFMGYSFARFLKKSGRVKG